jgi:hypothetical protein
MVQKKKKQSSGPLETSGLRVFAARLDLLLQLSNPVVPYVASHAGLD